MTKYVFTRGAFIRLFILVLILGGLGYGGFYFWQQRDQYFFKGEDLKTEQNIVKKQAESSEDDSINSTDGEVDGSSDNKQDSDDEYFMPKIHQSDCDNECVSRKAVDSEYRYCREICGLNEIKDKQKFNQDTAENIDDTEGDIGEEECDDIDDSFEEDVCWKEKAIREKKDKYCDEIYSEDLAKVCHNRVTEEIMK